MIKTQGLGRRRQGMSHDASVKHHKEVHSKLGLGQAEHMGKYVLHYVDRALSSDGSVLSDYPWDMFSLYWFRNEELWTNFLKWQNSDTDGQVIKADEENFLDRKHSYICPYDEAVSIDLPASKNVVDIVRLIKFRDGAVAQDSLNYHANTCVAAIKSVFGGALRKYAANHLGETISLAEGRVEKYPIDIVEIYKIDRNAIKNDRHLVEQFNVPRIAEAESQIIDRQSTTTFVCEEVPYIA